MAEAIAAVGLVGSIASLVDLSVKIVSRIRECTAQAVQVPKAFRALADRLPLLNQTLQQIQARAQDGRLTDSFAEELKVLVNSILEQVKYIEHCLSLAVPSSNASRFDRLSSALKSLAKDEKVREATGKIHQGIDVLVLHQTTSNIDISDRILEELSKLTLQYSSPLPASPEQTTFGLCLGRAPLIDADLFIGRESEIDQLHQCLLPAQDDQALVSIVGMGGAGKTQLSLAYARRHKQDYSSIFWVNARDEISLRQSFSALNDIVFPDDVSTTTSTTSDESLRIEKIRRWLSEPWNTQWLIIFDNYDDPNLPNLRSTTGYDIRSFFPLKSQGNILITTRSPKLDFSKRLMLQKFDKLDLSIAVLSRRSQRELENDKVAHKLAERLDGLPLALATAGTYLGQTGISCEEYLELYETTWLDLHDEHLMEYEDRTLASTWIISYNQIKEQDPDAASLFAFFAYLSNQDIWYELVRAGQDEEVPWVSRVSATKIRFDRTMAKLRDYSLVDITPGLYRIHMCLHDWIMARFCPTPQLTLFMVALRGITEVYPGTTNLIFSEKTPRLLAHIRHLIKTPFQTLWEDCGSHSVLFAAGDVIVNVLIQWGLNQEAEKICAQILAGKEKLYGRNNPQTLSSVSNLGMTYYEQGKLQEAEQLYLRALAGKEAALGMDHLNTLATVNNLGRIYSDQGKFVEAERHFTRAIAGYEKAGDRGSGPMMNTLTNLGIVYENQGKLAEAEYTYKRALAGHEKTVGMEHIKTLRIFNNLGVVYRVQGKLADAELMFMRAKSGWDKLLGPLHVSSLEMANNIGLLYSDRGMPVEAERCLKESLVGKEQAIGPEHSSTLTTMINLGLSCVDLGKFTEAEQLYKRAIVGLEKTMGMDHPWLIEARMSYARLRLKQCQAEAARHIYLQTVSACERVLQNQGPGTVSSGIIRTQYGVSLSHLANMAIDNSKDQDAYMVKLIAHLETYGKDSKNIFRALLVTLLHVGDNENVQKGLQFFPLPDGESGAADLGGTTCCSCHRRLNTDSGMHQCRQCVATSLCEGCESARKPDKIVVPGCQGHEFCDFGTVWRRRLGTDSPNNDRGQLDQWIGDLKRKYRVNLPVVEDGVKT